MSPWLGLFEAEYPQPENWYALYLNTDVLNYSALFPITDKTPRKSDRGVFLSPDIKWRVVSGEWRVASGEWFFSLLPPFAPFCFLAPSPSASSPSNNL